MVATKIELYDPTPIRQGVLLEDYFLLQVYNAIAGSTRMPRRDGVTKPGEYPVSVGEKANPTHEFTFVSDGDGGKLVSKRIEKGTRRFSHRVVDEKGAILKRRGRQEFPLGIDTNQILGIVKVGKIMDLVAGVLYTLPLTDTRRHKPSFKTN